MSPLKSILEAIFGFNLKDALAGADALTVDRKNFIEVK